MSRWAKVPYIFINSRLPKSILDTIRDSVTYYVTGYEKTRAFKDNEWDGTETLLYLSKNGKWFFPVGVYPIIHGILEELGYAVDLDDIDFRNPELGKFKWVFPHELFDYQKEAILNTYFTGRGGTILLPTGAGKTTCALKMVALYDRPTLILVHTKDLLFQWEKAIKGAIGVSPTLYGAGKNEKFGDITVAMIQSLQSPKGSKRDLTGFDVLVADECHRIPADKAFSVAMRCPAKVRIGITATPNREDNRQLRIYGCTGSVTVSYTAEQLIDSGNLVEPDFVFYKIPNWESCGFKKKMKWQDAVSYGIIGNRYRNTKIVAAATGLYNEGKSVLICVDRIDHGEIIESMLVDADIPCVFLYSDADDSDRKSTLSTFGTDKDFVLISTLVKEGIDIPSMDSVILAAGGKSAIAAIQKIGRVMRPYPGKEVATVVDFADSGMFIASHFEDRCSAYAATYGKYFRPRFEN